MLRARLILLTACPLAILGIVAVAQKWLQRHSLDAVLAASLRSGRWVQARRYLERGANPRTVSPNKTTALMIAAEGGDVEWVRRLLDAGVPIDARNESGSAALDWAAGAGEAEAVTFLLGRGACVDLEISFSDDVARTAFSAGHKEITAEIQRRRELTRIMIDLLQGERGTPEQRRRALRGLLQQGALANGSDINGTALRWAAELRDVAAAQILLDAGADPDANPNWGLRVYPIEVAVATRHTPMVEFLLRHGADPSRHSYGRPPLLEASERGDAKIVRALLVAGADPNQKWEIGGPDGKTEVHTALRIARQERHNDVVRILEDAGAKVIH